MAVNIGRGGRIRTGGPLRPSWPRRNFPPFSAICDLVVTCSWCYGSRRRVGAGGCASWPGSAVAVLPLCYPGAVHLLEKQGVVMSMQVLTVRGIQALKPQAKRYEIFDALTPSLAIRVTPKGHKSWVLLYRHHGRLRRLTLGRCSAGDIGNRLVRRHR